MSEVFRCAYSKIVDLDLLQPNPENPNKHPKEQIERLAKVIKYQGQRAPIVVSNRSGFITKGHGRLAALKHLGWKTAAVDYQDYDNEAQEYADIVADNAIASWAELQLEDINAKVLNFDDFDPEHLGIEDFKPVETENLEYHGDVDEVPEALPEPKVVRGEVYILGNHRLMCGDSTVITDVERLMNGEKADMVFTSPPYGVGLEYNSYDDSFENTLSTVQSVLTVSSKITDGYICLNWGDIVSGKKINGTEFPSQYSWLPIYDKTLAALGFYLWSQRIWKKPHARISAPWSASSNRNVTDWEYLYTWSNGKQRSNARQNGSHFGIIDSSESSQTDTLKDHPGAFPVFVAEKIVSIHTFQKFNVLDPFGGTGTTLIACEKTNRKCFMVELDPHYVGVILDRWQKFTGKKAHREDGKPWDEIRGE